MGAFEENMAETRTMLPIIRRFQASFDVGDITVVGAPGCFLQGKKKAIIDAGL